MKYERPPLFCFFCGKVGHGTKDCDEVEDEDDGEVKFGGWLRASPWKVGGMGERRIEGDRGSTCAKTLFITKPREKRMSIIKENVNEVTNILHKWGLNDMDKGCDKGGESESIVERAMEEAVGEKNLGEMKQNDHGNCVEEDSEAHLEPQLEVPNQEGIMQGRKVKIWRKKARPTNKQGKEMSKVSGSKRDERDGTINGLDAMEIEELRYLKRVSIVDNDESDGMKSLAEQVAGPTKRALGDQC